MGSRKSRIESLDEKAVGHKVHIGNTVFETGRHKSGDRENDGHDFIGGAAGAVGQPDRQANQAIAQDAQCHRLREAQTDFADGDFKGCLSTEPVPPAYCLAKKTSAAVPTPPIKLPM